MRNINKDRLSKLKAQYPSIPVDRLASLDPSPNQKFLPWLCKVYVDGMLTKSTEIKRALRHFLRYGKDLYRLHSIEELLVSFVAFYPGQIKSKDSKSWDRSNPKFNESVQSIVNSLLESDDTKYGCLMFPIHGECAAKILEYGKRLVPSSILTGDGFEEEVHVTVLYGFNPGFDVSRLQPLVNSSLPISITFGKVSRFECPEYDVVKFEIESPQLVALHQAIREQFADSITPSKWPYKPHCTIAYVTKGAKLTAFRDGGYNGISHNAYEGEEFVYSDSDSVKTPLVPAGAVNEDYDPDLDEVSPEAVSHSALIACIPSEEVFGAWCTAAIDGDASEADRLIPGLLVEVDGDIFNGYFDIATDYMCETGELIGVRVRPNNSNGEPIGEDNVPDFEYETFIYISDVERDFGNFETDEEVYDLVCKEAGKFINAISPLYRTSSSIIEEFNK